MAWPVANPVITYASVNDKSTRYVSHPFLFVEAPYSNSIDENFSNGIRNLSLSPGNSINYIFFRTAPRYGKKGSIGVVRSTNGGISWKYLGIALEESWDLSYPYVFRWKEEIYMIPDGHKSGTVKLYRATEFPLRWESVSILLETALSHTSIIHLEGYWFILGTEAVSSALLGGFLCMFESYGNNKEQINRFLFEMIMQGRYSHKKRLKIFYSKALTGPWIEHPSNPKFRDSQLNAGRIFQYNGTLYRFASNDSTKEKNVGLCRIDILTPSEFKESPVAFEAEEDHLKKVAAWDSKGRQNIDVAQLADGHWLSVIDGDWRDKTTYFPWILISIIFIIPFVWIFTRTSCWADVKYRFRTVLRKTNCHFSSGGMPQGSVASRVGNTRSMLSCLNPDAKCFSTKRLDLTVNRKIVLSSLFVMSLMIASPSCILMYYLSIGDATSFREASNVMDAFSKYTIVIKSFKPREVTLRKIVEHYGYCPGVSEIVVSWNEEESKAARPEGLHAAVPIRIRKETDNTYNVKFRPDNLIKTRAVLLLDDDLLIRCSDIEYAFSEWRRYPNALVGFQPRLISRDDMGNAMYFSEGQSMRRGKYNAVLTSSLFLDGEKYFNAYWSTSNEEARKIVDEVRNCDDLLMNFVAADSNIANATKMISHVRARRRMDISWMTKVGISRNGNHIPIRLKCINRFSELFGKFPLKEESFDYSVRNGGFIICLPTLGCVHL